MDCVFLFDLFSSLKFLCFLGKVLLLLTFIRLRSRSLEWGSLSQGVWWFSCCVPVSEHLADILGEEQVRLPQNPSAMSHIFIVQPQSSLAMGPSCTHPSPWANHTPHYPTAASQKWECHHCHRVSPSELVQIPASHQTGLVVNIQCASAVTFSHVFLAGSGQTGTVRTSWVGGYICSRKVRPLPTVKNQTTSSWRVSE